MIPTLRILASDALRALWKDLVFVLRLLVIVFAAGAVCGTFLGACRMVAGWP